MWHTRADILRVDCASGGSANIIFNNSRLETLVPELIDDSITKSGQTGVGEVVMKTDASSYLVITLPGTRRRIKAALALVITDSLCCGSGFKVCHALASLVLSAIARQRRLVTIS